ncbi:YihY/virulence factor BrkB family protein [Pararhizobium sp. O133]|uniref:YihY/virulence factor BrkB family protein n=1 Tax=Pararhizobium sp. O133 TaxID=3449278 RepID=UPI003F684D05
MRYDDETKTSSKIERSEPGRGRDATTPNQIPARGLRDVFWRLVGEVIADRVTLVAAGVTFYILLSLFPALGALVSLYGFIADPATMAKHITFFADILPPGAFDIILTQLNVLVQAKASTLSISFVVGLAIALWSANSAVKALFDAMNIAYGEAEKRGIIRLNLISLAFTGIALVLAAVFIAAIGGVPALLSYLWLDRWQEILIRLLRWPIVLVVIGAGVALIYRVGPSREDAKIRWLTWGAVFSTLLWLTASILFSFYLSTFANYEATYGALGALIGFMIWTWISVIIVIVGAELNAELEHQTARDTTTGPPVPMGERGAYVADTVGPAVD